ncbi:hypothetical protein NKI94_30180 [Mesorhizobium australicum]|uniref:hypothetical protein n=1 Tax=Mesorhizobium australicum TaxID=536018 RepID=UPI003335F797
MSKESPSSLDYTEPLFIQNRDLAHGHDDKVLSATGTFVKWQGQHYVVTCRHVLEAVRWEQKETLAIMAGRGILNFSSPTPSGPISSFRELEARRDGSKPDIAISRLPAHWWNQITKNKSKKAVDLDAWVEPVWPEIRIAKACGWLQNYKEMSDEHVSTTGVWIVAEMASAISPQAPEFTMFSPDAENALTLLSGVSGGVVVSEQNNVEVPIGVVFEGFPGEADSLGDNRPAAAYTQPGDLMVRGHVLTPEIFQDWLQRRSDLGRP